MEVKIKTPKGVFNAGQNWTGVISDLTEKLEKFFTAKRLDALAEIIKEGVLSDLDNERKPSGGSLRDLKELTWKYKKTNRKLYETGRLRSQIDYTRKGEVRIISVVGDRKQVAGYLQFGTRKMESFEWFGLNNESLKKLQDFVSQEWRKAA